MNDFYEKWVEIIVDRAISSMEGGKEVWKSQFYSVEEIMRPICIYILTTIDVEATEENIVRMALFVKTP